MAPLVAGLSRDPWGDEALHGRRRWKPVWTALGILGVVLICAFDLYAVVYGGGPPDNWRNPPLYAGAQNVQVQDFGEQGRPQLNSGTPLFLIKIITFTVADRPEQVRAYYADVYTGRGWHDLDVTPVTTDPNRLSLMWRWRSGALRPSSDYLVDVTAAPAASGGSDVKIEVSTIPG